MHSIRIMNIFEKINHMIHLSLVAIFSSCQQAQTDQSSLDESPAELVTYYGQEINQDGILIMMK